MIQTDTRLRFLEARSTRKPELFADVVCQGLSAPQKSLPCRYFYDHTGSHLFEMICDLPEYYLTRTERSILERYADAMILAAGSIGAIVEFGSGSSQKTRLLLDAALARHAGMEYMPVDISGEFLYTSSRRLLDDYPTIKITSIAAEYNEAMALIPQTADSRLFLFMGSNIGNFDPCEATIFLAGLRSGMRSTDSLLVGIDLYKSRATIEPAYNDAAGVTARFNKNLLQRINNELRADFDLDAFDHHAPFVHARSRVEMRLVSNRDQVVRIGSTGSRFEFAGGEYIHTENSHKYSFESFRGLAEDAGFAVSNRWQDNNDWCAVCLLKPMASTQASNRSYSHNSSELETNTMANCTHLDQIEEVTPNMNGCEECLKSGDTWVHLRMCLICGHVGCCDSSRNKHATKHFHATNHPIVRSIEPGEDWRWCYIDQEIV